MGRPEVAHMGPQPGSRAFLGITSGLGELKQGEDRPEEGQRGGLRVKTAPELADAVLWPWLAELWRGFVMANIGWLSLLTAVFELAVGLGLLARGYARRAAVLAALGFFAFILVLGYSWPADGWWEDFVKNRAGTLVMAAALVPLLHVPERSPRT